ATHARGSPRVRLPLPVAHRSDRNVQLGIPTRRVHRRRDGPGAVPVEVEAAQRPGHGPRLAGQLYTAAFSFVHDLRVVLDARRGGGEDETVLPIVVGIEEDAEVVALRDVAVAHLLAGHDAGGIAVIQPGAAVQR